MITLPDRILIGLMLFSVQATEFKIADIQLFEILTLASLPYLVLRFRGFFSKESLVLFAPLLLLFFCISLVAYFKIEFHPPPGIGPLKAPLAISLVRLSQFGLIFLAFNFIWLILKESGRVRWAIRLYVKTSFIIAALTCLSFLVAETTGRLTPLVYDTAKYLASEGSSLGMVRARGLFIEGGPYGISLLATFILAFMLRSGGGRVPLYQFATFGTALILSQSKAALAGGAVLVIVYTLANVSFRRLAVLAVTCMVFFCVLIYFSRYFLVSYVGYYKTIEQIAGNSAAVKADNGDVAYGRIAALFIAPRMVMENPLLGVGMGNYSLVRNDPDFRGSFPKVSGWDLPGIGVLTVLVECGVIGVLFLMASYYFFYRITRPPEGRYGFLFSAPLILQASGVQFYFAYHWLLLLMVALFLQDGTGREGERDGLPPPRRLLPHWRRS